MEQGEQGTKKEQRNVEPEGQLQKVTCISKAMRVVQAARTARVVRYLDYGGSVDSKAHA